MSNKTEQLRDVVRWSSDIQTSWERYAALCVHTRTKEKKLLTQVSYYKDVFQITKDIVKKAINKEIRAIYKKWDKMTEEKRLEIISKLEQQYAAKRNIQCNNCDAQKVLTIISKARDSNCVTVPTGFKFDGYLPYIPSVCHGDGIALKLCVNCGHVIGFDRDKVVKAIEEMEREDLGESESD